MVNKAPNLGVAMRHVALLTGSPDTPINARLIHDRDRGAPAQNLHGPLDELWPQIEAAQRDGCGVFIVVNEGGHSAKEITRVRSLYIDADNMPLPEEWHVPPDFLVVRDPTHWHAYWLVDDLPVEQFKAAQRRLIARYGSDKAVCDLPRVMRIAGTLHLKSVEGSGSLVTLRDLTGGRQGAKGVRTAAEIVDCLPIVAADETHKTPSSICGEPIDVAVVKEAASWVDPDCPYPGWRDMIAAIRAAPVLNDDDLSQRRNLAHRWSEGLLDRDGRYATTSPNRYDGPDAVDKIFDGMPPRPGGIGIGTLLAAARAAGWHRRADGRSSAEVFAPYMRPANANDLATASQTLPARAPEPRRRFQPLLPAEMRALPEPSYLVDAIIPEKSIVLIYGAPGSLKTFVVLDILVSVAAGRRAFGELYARQGGAILCAGEAPHAIARKRWPAAAKARGVTDLDAVPFAIIPAVPLVAVADQIDELIREIDASPVQPKIIAIDTVARASGGLDENASGSAGLIIQAAEKLRDHFGCSVVLVHHSGKVEERGSRGSSALPAGVDAIFEVKRNKETLAVTLHCTKMKDADEPHDIYLRGEELDGSLAFYSVTATEHAAVTRANPPLSPGAVGKALQAAGATQGVSISTTRLAEQMCGAGAAARAIEAMKRRLGRGAESRLAAYVAVQAMGKGTARQWTFPDADAPPG